MKTILKYSIFFLLVIPFNLNAQSSIRSNLSSTEIKSMNDAVQFYWDWKSDEDPIKAVTLLEEVTLKHQSNWIAPYWAAYISTQIANSSDKNKIEHLEKAQSYFNQAIGRYAYTTKKEDNYISSNFNALHSLILRLTGFYFKSINQEIKAKEYSDKSIEQLNAGIKKSAENPILMVLAATEVATTENKNFGNIIAAIALLEKAKKEFEKIKNRDKTDITYWNEHWIDPWLNNLRPPSK